MIIQEHFPRYVILQFARHTSVTEEICNVKVKVQVKLALCTP